MVQILPSFDPGKEIGQQLGGTMSQLGQFAGKQAAIGNVLQQLNQLGDKAGPTEIASALAQVGAIQPGMMAGLSPLGEKLMSRSAGLRSFDALQKQLEGLKTDEQVQKGVEALQAGDYETFQTLPRVTQEQAQSLMIGPDEMASVRGAFEAGPEVGYKALSELKERKELGRQIRLQEQKAQREVTQEDIALRESIEKGALARATEAADNAGYTLTDAMKRDFNSKINRAIRAEEQRAKEAKQSGETYEKRSKTEIANEFVQDYERAMNTLADLTDQATPKPLGTMGSREHMNAISSQIQSVYEVLGKTPETIEMIRSKIGDRGWADSELAYMLSPPNEGLVQQFNQIAKEFPVGLLSRTENIKEIGSRLAENFTEFDDPYLAKVMLVQDIGVPEMTANKIIKEMSSQLNLEQWQKARAAKSTKQARGNLFQILNPLLKQLNIPEIGETDERFAPSITSRRPSVIE